MTSVIAHGHMDSFAKALMKKIDADYHTQALCCSDMLVAATCTLLSVIKKQESSNH